ncbi:MAG: molybdopterin-dependent oxidoreductase, partial [Thaumarchaeota archaeon]|nr:molybdopterin-dependent oxidoreductase [Nitrososphaerota archaeon]
MQKATQIEEQAEEWIPSVCDMCYNACTIRVKKVNGRVMKIEGLPGAPPNFGVICAKGNAAIMNLYNPHRIARPLIRTNPEKGLNIDPKWKETSWEEALNIVAERLRKTREDDPRKLVAATFDGQSFVILRAFLSAFGSPNFTVGPAGYFCGNGVHPVAYTLTGSIDVHPNLKYCNYCILFGNQFGFVTNHGAMPLSLEMADARARGLKLVVVDPVLSNAAGRADQWIPIRPGTDGALALSMIHVLVNELGIFDQEFLKKYTNGPYLVGEDEYYVRDETGKPMVWDPAAEKAKPYDSEDLQDYALQGCYRVEDKECKTSFQIFKEHVAKYAPEAVQGLTDVPAPTIRKVAKELGEAAQIGKTIVIEGKELPHRPVAVTWYRGPVAHRHAMHTGLAIGLLNVIVGAVDVPGGLLNVNGAGPFGFPKEGPDGILVPGNRFSHMRSPHPYQKPRRPDTLELVELFPVAVYARAMLWLGVLEPDRFKIPYKPEVLIQCRTNLVANTANPE